MLSEVVAAAPRCTVGLLTTLKHTFSAAHIQMPCWSDSCCCTPVKCGVPSLFLMSWGFCCDVHHTCAGKLVYYSES